MTKSSVSLIICTRNRPKRIERLLTSVVAQRKDLNHLLVVDSSTNNDTRSVVNNLRTEGVTYLSSLPGLPRQRNEGIRYLELHSPSTEIYSFLDDDVEIPDDYFKNVREVFELHPRALSISGFDLNLTEAANSLIHRVCGLRSRDDYGKVLRSGVAVPVYQPVGVVAVDWAPGHSLNVRKSTFDIAKFDPSIRMYGEDVDFCLRAGANGGFFISETLGVRHQPETTGRENIVDSEAFNAGFRYQLSRAWPKKVSRAWSLWASLVLLAGYLVSGLTRLDKTRLQRALGLGLFFRRLLSGRDVTQSQVL